MKQINRFILVVALLAAQITTGSQPLAKPKSIKMIKPLVLDHNAWLQKADSDLLSAKKLLKFGNSTLDTAVYHTQQAAEKALKAYLVRAKKDNSRSHDLVEILNANIKINPTFVRFRQYAYDLTPYATCHRYPGYACYYANDTQCSLTRAEAIRSIKKAEAIVKFVKEQISLLAIQPVG